MNFLKAFEEAIVTALAPLKNSKSEKAFATNARYDGQFDGQFGLPTDFNIRGTYALVELLDSTFDVVTSNRNDLKTDSRIQLYVGAQMPKQLDIRDAIGELLVLVADALHNKKLVDANGAELARLKLVSYQQYLVMKGHIVWTVQLTAKSLIQRIGQA